MNINILDQQQKTNNNVIRIIQLNYGINLILDIITRKLSKSFLSYIN